MANPNIITVDGVAVHIRGRVEFEGSILSVPNNRSIQRLLELLEPKIEGEKASHTIFFRDQKLPAEILLQIRAPRKPSSEG